MGLKLKLPRKKAFLTKHMSVPASPKVLYTYPLWLKLTWLSGSILGITWLSFSTQPWLDFLILLPVFLLTLSTWTRRLYVAEGEIVFYDVFPTSRFSLRNIKIYGKESGVQVYDREGKHLLFQSRWLELTQTSSEDKTVHPLRSHIAVFDSLYPWIFGVSTSVALYGFFFWAESLTRTLWIMILSALWIWAVKLLLENRAYAHIPFLVLSASFLDFWLDITFLQFSGTLVFTLILSGLFIYSLPGGFSRFPVWAVFAFTFTWVIELNKFIPLPQDSPHLKIYKIERIVSSPIRDRLHIRPKTNKIEPMTPVAPLDRHKKSKLQQDGLVEGRTQHGITGLIWFEINPTHNESDIN